VKKLVFLFAFLLVGVAAAAPNVVSTTQTSATVEGLDCGSKYRFSIRKYNADGSLGSSTSYVYPQTKSCPDAQPPSAPQGLATTGATGTSISVSWSASTDNVGVAGYDLYRNGAKVDSTSATSYTFGGISCGTSHTLAVEARDAAGNRSAASTITASTAACAAPPSCPTGEYVTQYYANTTLTGSPALERCQTAIDHDWGSGSPGGTVPTDRFSARWTGKFSFAAGPYDFTATADDGIRVWVDGTPLIDVWKDQSATTYRATKILTAGDHDVKVEYYENGGAAVAKVNWQLNQLPPPLPPSPPAPPPPTPTACSQTLVAGQGSIATFVGGLQPGQIGCLQGTFNQSVSLTKAGVTVQSAPGQTATICGYVSVQDSADDLTLRGLKIDGSCAGASYNTMYLRAERSLIEGNEIMNNNQGQSCILLGQSGTGEEANQAVISRNRIHHCGRPSTWLDHGVYLARTTGTVIENNTFYEISGFPCHFYGDVTNTTYRFNVSDGGAVTTRGGCLVGADAGPNPSGNTIENNIIAYTANAAFEGWGGSNNVVRNNCTWANADGQFSGSGFTNAGGNLNANPLFVNRGAHEYRLQAGSPCAGKGPQ
jgi:PA14 domain/Right handed beta helix region